MAQDRAQPKRQEAQDDADWSALRHDLGRNLGEAPDSGPAGGASDANDFLDHINALRSQLKQQNERLAGTTPARGAEPGRNPVGESLQSAIERIRAGQRTGAPRSGPALGEVVEMTARLSERIGQLEASVNQRFDEFADPASVSRQIGLLTETIGQLSQLVKKSADTSKLEAKLAEFLALERADPAIDSVTQRLERLNESVRKLADIQVRQVRGGPRAESDIADAATLSQLIEASLRRMYDRLDSLERSVAVAPEEMDRLAEGIHTLATALDKEGRSATIGDELIGRINAIATYIETLEPREGSTGFHDLKTEIGTLRRYMVEAFEPRFDALEDQIKDLSMRLTGAEDGMGRELIEEQLRLLIAKVNAASETLDDLGRRQDQLATRTPDMAQLVDIIAAKTAAEVNAMKPTDTIGVSNIAVAAMRESIAQVDRRLDNLQDTIKRLARVQNGGAAQATPAAPASQPARPASPLKAPVAEAVSRPVTAFDEPAPPPPAYAPPPRGELPPKPASTLGENADDVFRRAAEKAAARAMEQRAARDEHRESSPVSRESFIEAARRAAQRSSEPSVLDANGGFLGKALARLKRKNADEPEAPDAISEPELPAPPKDAAPAEPASDEVVIEEPDAPHPAVAEEHESFLSRHRRPILLGASFVAVALMTLNLIGQRMGAGQGEALFEVAETAATNDSAEIETATLEAPPALEPGEILAPEAVRMVGAVANLAADAPVPAVETATEDEALAFADTGLPVDDMTTGAINPADLDPMIGPDGLRAAAQGGDARAQFEIAAAYTEGQIVPQDYAAAALWYERAAASGFAPAQYRLGNLYENGRGVPLDLELARQWYQSAAEAGNRMAMHNLAALHAGGQLPTQDFASAAIWFERAANLGVKDSQFNLGMLYARGLGVTQDFVKSYMWFDLAAQGGDADAAAARDDIARSLDAAALQLAEGLSASWRVGILDIPANYAPIGAWDADFDAGVAIGDPALIAQVQEILGKLGYDIGTPDGVMGPKTEIAIKAFEAATGMNETGAVNPRLLAVLGSQPV